MSDIEQRLRDAFAASKDVVPDVDVSVQAGSTQLSRRSIVPWLSAAAAAVVVLGVAGAVIAVNRNHHTTKHVPTSVGPFASLVVHDGDKVEAIGVEQMLTDGRVELCDEEPFVSADLALPAARKSLAPVDCSATRIAWLEHYVGPSAPPPSSPTEDPAFALPEFTRVVGIWHDGTIDVQTSGPAKRPDPPGPSAGASWPIPCSKPTGGWPNHGTADLANTSSIGHYVRTHPESFAELWVNYDPSQLGPTAEGGPSAVPVLMVPTVSDVAAAEEQVSSLFDGPLCVYSVRRSTSDLDAVKAAVKSIAGAQNVVQGGGTTLESVESNRIRIGVLVLTPEMADALTPYSEAMFLTAAVHPAS